MKKHQTFHEIFNNDNFVTKVHQRVHKIHPKVPKHCEKI